MKVFAPPQKLVELMLNFGHAYRDKSNSGLYNIPLGCLSCPPLISDTTYWPPQKQYAEINPDFAMGTEKVVFFVALHIDIVNL